MSSNNIFMKRFGKNFGSKISNDINVTLSKIQLSWEKKCFSHLHNYYIYKIQKYQQCHGVICFDININNNKTKWKKKNNIIHIHNNKWYYNTTKYLTQYSIVGTYSCIKPHNFFCLLHKLFPLRNTVAFFQTIYLSLQALIALKIQQKSFLKH